jgi:D-tyrosyl-tRNA(Tyr) deacylase
VRSVIQRVTRASVSVDGRATGEIGDGLLALVGVAIDDVDADAEWMADKIANLRVFRDDAGLMNRSVTDIGGAVLVVSQFTLHGDARKGRRPSFITAAKEPLARTLYERVGELLEKSGLRVAYGEFGADMDVELVNAGPVTILLDSKRSF